MQLITLVHHYFRPVSNALVVVLFNTVFQQTALRREDCWTVVVHYYSLLFGRQHNNLSYSVGAAALCCGRRQHQRLIRVGAFYCICRSGGSLMRSHVNRFSRWQHQTVIRGRARDCSYRSGGSLLRGHGIRCNIGVCVHCKHTIVITIRTTAI